MLALEHNPSVEVFPADHVFDVQPAPIVPDFLPGTLDDDALRHAAPSVFATTPHWRMTDRYQFVPTIEIVNLLRDGGYYPVRASQSKARSDDKRAACKHVIRFRHADYLQARAVVGEEVPEFILIGSHDGTSPIAGMMGLFRFVCSNGAVVESASIGGFGFKHIGHDSLAIVVNRAVQHALESSETVMGTVNAWKSRELTYDARLSFAAEALALRGENKAGLIPQQLLGIKRTQDERTDLWTTFNVVQENMLRGGLRGRLASGRQSTTRAIVGASADLEINRQLWALGERYAAN